MNRLSIYNPQAEFGHSNRWCRSVRIVQVKDINESCIKISACEELVAGGELRLGGQQNMYPSPAPRLMGNLFYVVNLYLELDLGKQ